jgi:hypothetical protein
VSWNTREGESTWESGPRRGGNQSGKGKRARGERSTAARPHATSGCEKSAGRILGGRFSRINDAIESVERFDDFHVFSE